MLSIKNLDVKYGAVLALKSVSLTVEQGEIVTLIGANGAGKSTTLMAISGLVRPSAGRIRLLDHDLSVIPPHAIVRLGVSHVPEGRRIFANLTVSENLDLGAYVRSDRAMIKQDRERVLALFPQLTARLGQPAATLSGGEQQMLAMGRALMARPRLMLLDEPSLGLAPFLVKQIFHTIREINQEGTTILLVEQNAHMALAIAHRGYVLETGRVVLSGQAEDLAKNEDVKRAYLGE